ncbi:MAG TPA: hypothetical protein VEZ11_17845 [Thermoanaerobaculia bacterium]|nr:hypothetical protein [Thermoanaerobaculia bacterium]
MTTAQFEALCREQEAFDVHLDDMMKTHSGEFVLFKDGEPVAFFRSYEEAYGSGITRFGLDQTFLVSEVKRREPQTTSWELGAI